MSSVRVTIVLLKFTEAILQFTIRQWVRIIHAYREGV
jgi:hypothetical protein